ncbi:hypothetical protein QBZ16_003514 [Prototheca wickerhamii]|uniref:Uncharacterized protein n=1 Tax=Prototheca wickerhamii TaxID=3111 RepID=A0AAD9MHJ6_PROWI|nr:hypothetical protein QBZ16_003514 [Prototheca wickerhamii]
MCAAEPIDIPPGTAPFAFNISCVNCYSTSRPVAVTVAYASDPSAATPLATESLSITRFEVTSAAGASEPATVTVSLSGLAVGEANFLTLWCNSPAMVGTAVLQASATDYAGAFSVQPGLCGSNRYLVVTSADQAHVVVARLNDRRQE